MFPHPCGEQFEQAVAAGADPAVVVPDEYVVVKGGAKSIPPAGATFSGAVGPTLTDAAAAVPHGQVRVTTVGAVRAAGGVVRWEPEISRYSTPNKQHVNIVEAGATAFSELTTNPVPRRSRIDGTRP